MKGDYELFVACDDGRVKKLGQGFTTYACIAFNRHLRPIGMDLNILRIDGLEASSMIAYSLLVLSKGRRSVLLLDSLTIAGFNVVSPATILKLAGTPTIVIYSYKPSYERLRKAFEKLHFRDIRSRVLKVIDKAREVNTRKGKLWVLIWGIDIHEAQNIIEKLQVHSRVPEPLRIAHNIASEVSLILNYMHNNLI